MSTAVRIEKIKVGERFRKDLGDVSALAVSIRERGLLHPLAVTPDHTLIAGERRLAALKLLDFTEVPVTVIQTLNTAVSLLEAERDENTCRKDMTIEEKVALGKAIEELEKPKAEERKLAALKQNRGSQPTTTERQPRTQDVVGPALGMGGVTYSRAKTVVDKATDPTVSEATRTIARDAVQEMNATGKVNPAFNKVAESLREDARRKIVGGVDKTSAAVRERRDRIRALAQRAYTSEQIAAEVGIGESAVRAICRTFEIPLTANAVVGARRRIDPNRVVDETAIALEGLVIGVGLVEVARLDPSKIEHWATSLSNSLRSLNRLAKQLKEMARVES